MEVGVGDPAGVRVGVGAGVFVGRGDDPGEGEASSSAGRVRHPEREEVLKRIKENAHPRISLRVVCICLLCREFLGPGNASFETQI